MYVTVVDILGLRALAAPTKGGETTTLLDYASIVISALALVVSASIGWANRSTSKRAMELAEQQEVRRTEALGLHLNESVSWRLNPDERLLGFHLLVSNPTDRSSTLVRAELHVTYTVDGVVTTAKVPPVMESGTSMMPVGVSPVELPVRLDANDAVPGWFLFRVPRGLTRNQPVDRFDVVLRDIHDMVESLQVTVFREADDSEAN